ncbi:hypothetical protein RCL_jg20296.t2 [Rhizophagus clarus]|uniref:Uncharacterized protein n=1 Tax=Rhizophagus clarus TaxID=94130 RepID=A0A8H3KU71_9GLOM|nr:hypothetical protein RCL_jg20296.t2 [Rhizophagus clarus]
MTIFVKHKSEELPTRWFQGSWTIKEIRDFTQYKAYKRVLEDVNITNMRTYCKSIHENHQVICTKLLKIGENTGYMDTKRRYAIYGGVVINETGSRYSFNIGVQWKRCIEDIIMNVHVPESELVAQGSIDKDTIVVTKEVSTGMQGSEEKVYKDPIQQYILYRNSGLSSIKDMPGFEERKELFENIIKEFNLSSARLIQEKNLQYAIIYVEANFKTKEEILKALNTKPEVYWKQWRRETICVSFSPLVQFPTLSIWMCGNNDASYGGFWSPGYISSNLFGCRYDGSGRMEKEIRTIYFFEFNSFSKILMK